MRGAARRVWCCCWSTPLLEDGAANVLPVLREVVVVGVVVELPSLRWYHWTENHYIINLETIMDVNNYIPFSIINSQTIDVM